MPGVVSYVERARWPRRALAVAVTVNLLMACGVAALQAADSTEDFATADALAEFKQRSAQAAPTQMTSTTTAVPTGASGDGADLADTAAPTSTTSTSTTAPPPVDAGQAAAVGAPTTAVPQPPPLPAEGVYVYDTVGYEKADFAGGARHDYPDETTATIVYGGCGYTERWQPLHERWDENEVCQADDRHTVLRYSQYHEFFGQNDQRDLQCDGATWFDPGWVPGDTERFRCWDERTDSDNRIEILPREEIVIGGVPIMAIRGRSKSDITGDAPAYSEIDMWLHPETGLTLKRVSLVDGSSSGPAGSITYHEEYTVTLQSLEPLR